MLLTAFSVEAAIKLVTTKQTILGSGPYLTFDNGATKATTTDELLWIKLSNGQQYSKNSNFSSLNSPIELPVADQTFEDIQMIIPKTANEINLSNLIGAPYSYGRDDNGDKIVNVAGTLKLSIEDVNNKSITRC